MPQKLSEHPLATEWLKQFNGREVHVARFLLDLLKLVPTDEFERAMKKQISDICSETEDRIAIFPVDKGVALEERVLQFHLATFQRKTGVDPVVNVPATPEQSAGPQIPSRRKRFSSADRIGHLLEAIKGAFPRRISVAPTINSMRAERVKHVVLVDDLVATGKSICDFWKAWAHPSLRSWLSRRQCRLWIVAYAGHAEGLVQVNKRITYLVDERFRLELKLPPTDALWPNAILSACSEYGLLTGKSGASRGFRGVMSPVVFQYRCPNSTAAILWDSSNRGWRGIFPNRSVPLGLHDCFDVDSESVRHAELLWNSAQYRLSLRLLEDLQTHGTCRTYQTLLTFLGLLARNYRRERLSTLMLLSDAKITELFQISAQLGLLTPEDCLTEFGKDLIERSRRTFLVQRKDIQPNQEAARFYFPKQFETSEQRLV
jgi:hypothetical protein